MNKGKIAISLNQSTINHLDQLIKKHVFTNRSRAIQEAVQEKIERIDRNRLARECSKLDPVFEKEMAEEGLSAELNKWPEY